jgi:hypothetical protein
MVMIHRIRDSHKNHEHGAQRHGRGRPPQKIGYLLVGSFEMGMRRVVQDDLSNPMMQFQDQGVARENFAPRLLLVVESAVEQ